MLSLNSLNVKFNRLVHSDASERYVCVTCQKTFSEWKNFKRHGNEVHSETGWVSCKFCSLKTKRMYDLKRHYNRKHKSAVIVASLINDIVSDVAHEITPEVEDIESYDDVNVNTGSSTNCNDVVKSTTPGCGPANEIYECEYDKIRLQNIAECRAALRNIFPDPDEFKEPQKAKKPRMRKAALPSLPPLRSSSRIKNRSSREKDTEELNESSDSELQQGFPDSRNQDVAESSTSEKVPDPNAIRVDGPTASNEVTHGTLCSTEKFHCLPCDVSFR